MSYKIAIASGKGGTGKTTVALNLYYFMSQLTDQNIQLVDCDVEEPNDALFFGNTTVEHEEKIFQLVPKIDLESCTFCKKCVDYCEFNAITVMPSLKHAEIIPSLCHSCGACSVACEDGAISESPIEIGCIRSYPTPFGKGLIEGNLKIGSPMQTMVIKATKKSIDDTNNTVLLFDSPPGTSCPVVESVADTHYVILVTEPTPFGLHDLKLMVALLEELDKPFGIIINKAGIGDLKTHDYIDKNNLELLGEIPFSQEYASKYAVGNLLENIPSEIENQYRNIVNRLKTKMN
jgi:MinD superfamily P-loop ATPase